MSGNTVVNTFGISAGAPIGLGDMPNIAAAVVTWLTTDLMPLLSQDISAVGVNVLALDSTSAPSYTFTISPPIAGGVATDAVPANVALVTTFRTNKRGRSYRGRWYTAGIPSAQLNSPVQFTTQTASDLDDAFDALNAIIINAGYNIVVISRYENKQARSEGVGTPVSSFRTGTTPDTQRRRQPANI